jgi:hypothetical protein
MKKRNLIAGGLAVGVIVAIAVGTSGGNDTPGHETTSDRSSAPSAAPATPDGPATSFSDGTYLVGSDIEAGTYKTTGPDDSAWTDGCYWERAKNDSGDLDSIIANNYQEGPGRVTVNSGEVFKVSGDCEWRLVR